MKSRDNIWSVTIESDIGIVRTRNEDYATSRMVQTSDGELMVCALSDGMGGLKDGAEASRVAVNLAVRAIEEGWQDTPSELRKTLHLNVIERAHFDLRQLSKTRYGHESKIGATLVTMCLLGTNLVAGSIGDSSLYVVTGSEIERVFDLHRLPGTTNVLTQSVGASLHIAPVARELDVSEADYILACSDGLTDVVSDAEILQTLTQKVSEKEKLTSLVERAKLSGSTDNITVLLIAKGDR